MEMPLHALNINDIAYVVRVNYNYNGYKTPENDNKAKGEGAKSFCETNDCSMCTFDAKASHMHQILLERGFMPGSTVRLLQKSGSIYIVQVDESRYGIRKDLAEMILVSPEPIGNLDMI